MGGGGWSHSIFIVHSLTNVQTKNQTIKGKTPEWTLRLSAPFSSPESPACSSSGHVPWLSTRGATCCPGFRGSGLATSSTWPDVLHVVGIYMVGF